MADPSSDFNSAFNSRYNLITRKILRALSENSRASISDMSRSFGLSRVTMRSRVKRIEEEFGLQYTPELNESLLGLTSQHLISVKFDSKPDYARVERMLRQSYIPQVAVLAKGGYDMILYAVATSTKAYAHWDKSMQIMLSDYGADWRSSEIVHRQLGFFPLRAELIERLDLPQNYKGILEMLCSNARMPFRQISKQLNMHFNTVAYNFNRLVKTGYIKRFTITMDKPEYITLMSFFAKYRPREGYESTSATARKAFMSDDEYPLISRYLVCAPLIGSYDFFTLGAFDDAKIAYRNDVQYHKRLFRKHGIRVAYGEVEKMLLGRLPIRSVDTGKEYNKIAWDPNFEE